MTQPYTVIRVGNETQGVTERPQALTRSALGVFGYKIPRVLGSRTINHTIVLEEESSILFQASVKMESLLPKNPPEDLRTGASVAISFTIASLNKKFDSSTILPDGYVKTVGPIGITNLDAGTYSVDLSVTSSLGDSLASSGAWSYVIADRTDAEDFLEVV